MPPRQTKPKEAGRGRPVRRSQWRSRRHAEKRRLVEHKCASLTRKGVALCLHAKVHYVTIRLEMGMP